MWPGNAGSALLLDLAATDDVGERAHVITDGLAETEQQLMPFLGFLAKSHREANFPTQILTKLGRLKCFFHWEESGPSEKFILH